MKTWMYPMALGLAIAASAAYAEDDAAAQDKVRAELKAAGVDDPGQDVTKLNTKGYVALYTEHDVEKALKYFKWNIALFPKFGADLYDSLGDGYLEAGKADKAVEAYKKSLEIDASKSDNGKAVIDGLKADPKSLKKLQEESRKLNQPGMPAQST